MSSTEEKIEIDLAKIPIDYSWSFNDKTIKDTSYITHGYYTYPAKFIPQLAARLIREHSNENDIVVDPFLGSGTTLVEALVHSRRGIGTDINEVAFLIALTKTTPIPHELLMKEFALIDFDLAIRLNGQYEHFYKIAEKNSPKNERLDYWFLPSQKEKLTIIFSRILEVKNQDVKNFFLVGFAQILKSCSIWMQKSVKPTRDLKKKNYEPISLFLQQVKKMIKKNQELGSLLSYNVKQSIDEYRKIKCGDSRNVPCEDGEATLVVTSPPYVTSYEYADLHQLPSLWFGYMNELAEFRKKFIGSSYKENLGRHLKSQLAEKIVKQLGNNKKGREVQSYFADMLESFEEMKRVLKVGGKVCMVIGNTEFNGVKILNAEVFLEQFEAIGFKKNDVILREIPSKMLPSTRDEKTGKFAKTTTTDKLAYPTEFILIMEKL